MSFGFAVVIKLFLRALQNHCIISMMKKKKSLLTEEGSTFTYLSARRFPLSQIQDENPEILQRKRLLRRQMYYLKGFLGCIGGLMIHLVIGSLYQWGLLNPYMSSYLFLEGHNDLKTKDMAFVFPLMMFCIGTTMWIGVSYGEKIGFSNVSIITFTLGSLSVFASSFFANLIGFILFYVVGFGFAAGTAFLIPIRVCNDYFPNKQTYINGFILIGSGLGSVVFGSFAINYMNPDHLATINGWFVDPSLSHIPARVPTCIKWLSLFYFIVAITGSILLKPLQKFNIQKLEMQKTIISHTVVRKNKQNAGFCLTPKEAIVSQIFWVNVLIITLGCCGNILMNTNYRLYANHKSYSDQFLNLIGLVGSSANGLSRYFWSALFNKVGFKIIMTIILSVNILFLATVRFTVEIPQLYVIDFIIFNTTLGGMMVLAPTFSTLIFGKEVGPRVFGIFWCSFAVGNFIQYTYIMTLSDYIGIDGVILICIGMNLLNMLITIKYKFLGPWGNDLKYFKFALLPQYQVIDDNSQLLVHSVITKRNKSEIVSSFAYHQESLTYS